MPLHSLFRTFALLLSGAALLGALMLAAGFRQRSQRESALKQICRDENGQRIARVRARAKEAQIHVHESAGSILLSTPTPLPPGATFCHFKVSGDSVDKSHFFFD
jgi:hypothetical protein